jgi:hypothetical protein
MRYNEFMRGLNRNSVSLAGEFAVLSQLTLRGYDANMTLGHTKGVDILSSDPENGNMFKVEVKTSYGAKPSKSKLFGNTLSWVMTNKHETISDPKLFYCFVNIETETNIFRFFIVPSDLVAQYVKNQHKYWLSHREHNSQKGIDTSIRQFRIGLDDVEHQLHTPLAIHYENRWEFK